MDSLTFGFYHTALLIFNPLGVGTIALAFQIVLSLRKSKRLGFIPPIIFFVYSIFITVLFSNYIGSITSEWPFLIEAAYVPMLLMLNIFTVILLILHGVMRFMMKRKGGKKTEEAE